MEDKLEPAEVEVADDEAGHARVNLREDLDEGVLER